MNIEDLQVAILNAIQRRDELVSEFRQKRNEAAKAEVAYKMAYAKALLLNVDGKNAEERKGRAELAIEAELFRHKLTEAETEGVKLAVFAEADKISAYQSLLRTERDEIAAIQYGQRTGA